ncbi:ABC transporter ATP-binding protein [filamentous cyanobacterium LEGE 11480]|uniref:ABC transporter ATP-binding protein n=1 Tax=Romeriopsis navalis LEGE 11480 TaxID=2777977 RepID=A0A928VNS6_9CYAN|nr:ABC transporter ATP-binding protein [Romeriopsis navalis]MBE9031002.1 ABC transporter ATP-binding protein [Romeriopsis navalis LEGE 11480]
MSDIVIQVENLSKRYTLGKSANNQYGSFREMLSGQAKRLTGSFNRSRQTSSEQDFWALNDVSFDIRQGERVGVIGRNGAGKSTLLKVLSRITEPTSGRIQMRGRVASLLEVGTGFHPELTGRENIFLNGAILGMSKVEIKRKFDEIVDFAEVEKFLDTPVKRYSSGMYVRLAFAVAAHLEPEILIVDEVLAVGDSQFQNKCLGKMKDVAHGGRTVLFVSHNMAAIRQLCDSALMMRKGELIFAGSAEDGVKHYLSSAESAPATIGTTSPYGIELVDAYLEDEELCRTQSPIFDRDYQLHIKLNGHSPLSDCAIVIRIYDMMGTLVSSLCTSEEGLEPFPLKDELSVSFNLRRLPLYPGSYRASIFLFRSNDPVTYLEAEDALSFEVQPAIVENAMWAYRNDHGLVRLSQGSRLNQDTPILTH